MNFRYNLFVLILLCLYKKARSWGAYWPAQSTYQNDWLRDVWEGAASCLHQMSPRSRAVISAAILLVFIPIKPEMVLSLNQISLENVELSDAACKCQAT